MEYRIGKGWRIFAYIFCAALIIGGIFLLSSPLLGAAKKDITVFMIMGPVLIIFGFLALLDTAKTKVSIDDTNINVQRAFSFKSMLLNEIQGYSIGRKDRVSIVSKIGDTIVLPGYLGQGAQLHSWLKENYPDTDKMAVEAETQNILANEEFGGTTDEREYRLAKAKQVSKVSNVIGLIAVAWAFFYAKPYNEGMLILFALPLAGIYIIWHFKGLVRFDATKKSAYPSLSGLFLFAILGAGLRVMIDFDIYDFDHFWLPLIITSALLSLICIYACGKAIQEVSKKAVVIIFIISFTAMYSAAAIVFTNYYLDHSTPQLYTVEVKSKRISTGKTTTYYLGLDAWGRYTTTEDISVSKSLYNSVQTGDSVYIDLWKGKWDIPWFSVSAGY